MFQQDYYHIVECGAISDMELEDAQIQVEELEASFFHVLRERNLSWFGKLIDLKPGEAIFLGAGEPHAYIAGGILIVSNLKTSADHAIRYCRDHGEFGQCHKGRVDPQIKRYT